MKRKYLIVFIAIVVTVASCKNYLDVKPTDFTTPETYFNNAEDLEQALTGVYSSLNNRGTFSRNLVYEFAHSSDEGFYKRNSLNENPATYNFGPTNSLVAATWAALYSGINNANLLLANIDRPEMNEAVRGRIRGEALFLRAFLYFQLVHLWGDVPLILTPTLSGENVNNPSAPKREIYDQILADMTTAEGLVGNIQDFNFPGRINKTAVQGILARVCLKMAGAPLNDVSKFADAKEWADKVVLSQVHTLNPDYAQIFINHTQDLYDIGENLWEVEFAGNGLTNPVLTGGWFAKKFSVRNTSPDLYGYAEIGATAALYRKYDDIHDVRRDRNIATYYFRTTGSTVLSDTLRFAPTDIYSRDTGKWRIQDELATQRSPDFGPTNFPILRYADVLLMYAEAENEVNGPTPAAFATLNQVRTRAKARNFVAADAASKDAFRTLIQDERARELCFEGLRKFDLIRWGIFMPVMKEMEMDIQLNAPSGLRYSSMWYSNVSERNLLLPIPSLEISLNKSIKQNAGW
jgi:hypothetical protein